MKCCLSTKLMPSVSDPGILKPGARSRRGLIFRGLEIVFDAPLQLHEQPNALVVRVENLIHIVNIAC